MAVDSVPRATRTINGSSNMTRHLSSVGLTADGVTPSLSAALETDISSKAGRVGPVPTGHASSVAAGGNRPYFTYSCSRCTSPPAVARTLDDDRTHLANWRIEHYEGER